MPEEPDRRDFVKAIAWGGAAGWLAAPAAAQESAAPEGPPAPTEADARMDLLLARFGDRLDEDARKAVRREVEAQVKRSESLRTFELENGDGPMPVFTPFRARPADD